MPEGDTVWRTAHRLNEVFADRELVAADLRWPGLSTYALAGTLTVEVVPRGKHLLHRLASGWTIHSHLRMDGSWQVEHPQGPASADHRVRAVLATAEYRAIGWRLGMLDVVRTAEESSLVGHLGPDILGADWSTERAAERVGGSSQLLGAALLDQTLLAGIGTMWAAEGLFLARLDPFHPAAEVRPAALAALLNRVRRLMTASCDRPVPSSTGSTVPGQTTFVHGRSRRPCRRCGTPVAVRSVGPPTRERPMFYCPRCQQPG